MATRIPIPLGQQRQNTSVGMPAARAPLISVEDQTGRAVAGVAQALGQVGDAAQRQQREEHIAWVSKASSDDQIKWLQRLNELEDAAEPGAPNFTPNVLTEFDTYVDEAVNSAPENARGFYRESLTRQRTYLGQRAVTFESGKKREHTVAQYKGGLESDAAAIALDPTLYDERRAARMAALNSSALPSGVRGALVGESEASLAYAAGAAMIDRDPRAMTDAISAAAEGRDTTGYGWIRRLDSDRLQQLRARATTQADRLDNRARIEQDRALVRGQRAVGEMEKQVSTGIPARTEDMVRWAGMAQGTESEPQIRDLMRSQEEVQKVLRMPIAQQSEYVLRRRQEQQRIGASVTDVANLDRIERAIADNVKMLAENPLAWAEGRAAQPIPRMDISALSTPDGATAVGQQLRDRADVIRGIQRGNPAGTVNMRPLLAEEAQGLSNTLQTAGAKQKREILGSLYWAAGAPDVYQGVMDQVTGLSPFMGRLGRLAGSYESTKLANNWFSPDVVQSAGDVASIAIHGDEILRNGGKAGAISYPVPKDTEFVQAIQDRVGDLYRGAAAGDSLAGDFMQDAYAIKAYYVGRAAQEGDLSPDVNSDRVGQAITAVLGQAVEYRDSGRVLAPWGMSESQFVQRADAAVTQELAARGLSEKMGASVSSTGLIGIGPGTYAVTLGNIPVRDPKSGAPIIISMTPDGDAGRNGFGQRLSDQIPRSPR